MPETALRKGFGWFVLAMGAFVLAQQGPSGTLPVVAAVAGIGMVLAGACWRFVTSCPLRRVITA